MDWQSILKQSPLLRDKPAVREIKLAIKEYVREVVADMGFTVSGAKLAEMEGIIFRSSITNDLANEALKQPDEKIQSWLEANAFDYYANNIKDAFVLFEAEGMDFLSESRAKWDSYDEDNWE